ncbi:MOSC domain-containing protein [Brevundimonas bacteroides]|uniref:MOSC domain-containing protein n=1 Tax=Brevundimonas bacteroides TaxID=74311 RepID=UPI00049692EA|nr:MOSC N-terminal beta barrel domain-containing protein [Brevundimonas bacteroides]
MTALARIAALYRHPVKGLTPEPLHAARLEARSAFPGDRLFAVEVGPSGFDPEAPAHISKMRFAVLARIPALARVVSGWSEASGDLTVRAPGADPLTVPLGQADGDRALEAWLTTVLGDEANAPLKVLDGRGHRFMDDPKGAVSVLNLASLRDLSERIGRPLDPLRFRANVHVEGWDPWIENDVAGRSLKLGPATLKAIKPIRRCVAVDVDPGTGERDADLVGDLMRLYGHAFCGLYLSVQTSGEIAVNDPVEWI